jgi:uncharacterized protein YcbK (DUF882 family)
MECDTNEGVSENFRLSEFKCRCCGVAKVDPDLISALQELRNNVDKPIRIISGYRCFNHNKAVRGAKRSQHLLGKAADITIEGMSPGEVLSEAKKIEAFKNGGLGLYSQFVHCDVRGHKARW